MRKSFADISGYLLAGIMVSILLVAILICPADVVTAKVQMILASSKVEGTILSCRVISQRSRPDSATTYGTEVTYEYMVQGQRMTGTRLAPGFLGFVKSPDGHEIARKYPVGSKVVVHYNPRRPAFAFIERGVLSLSVGLSLICIGITALGCLKQFRPDWSLPRSLAALLYAVIPAGLITVVIMPQYCDASLFLSKAYLYGGLYGGIYLILFIKSRKANVAAAPVQETWSATKVNDELTRYNESKPSMPLTRLNSKKDVVRFIAEDTGDKSLAVFLADVIERIGRDGYIEVERGGDGHPYAVEYQPCQDDSRKASEVQAELQGLRQEWVGAQIDSDRDRIERQIASLAGGLCTIRINVMTSDEFNRQRELIIGAWGKLRQITRDMK